MKQNKNTIKKQPFPLASSRKSNCFLKQLTKEKIKQIFSISLGTAPSDIPFSPAMSSNFMKCFLEEFKRLVFVLMHNVKKSPKICPVSWTQWDVLARDKVATSGVMGERDPCQLRLTVPSAQLQSRQGCPACHFQLGTEPRTRVCPVISEPGNIRASGNWVRRTGWHVVLWTPLAHSVCCLSFFLSFLSLICPRPALSNRDTCGY